jgi:hypothetical protein
MWIAIVTATAFVSPDPPPPPDVPLRGKTVSAEVFRAQARRITAPIEATQSIPAAYVEGVIEKMFSGAFQVSVKIGDRAKFIVPVDSSKLPGSGHMVGDPIRVFGVVRQSKLDAHWWEYWLPGVELTAKAAAKLDEHGARIVTGKATNNGAEEVEGLKVTVVLTGAKSKTPMVRNIDVGDLGPGETKEFSASFALADAEAKKATNASARVWTYQRAERESKTSSVILAK